MHRRFVLSAAGLITALAPALGNAHSLAAQRDRGRNEREYRSRIDTTVSIERGGTVDLSLVSGKISVSGWTKPQVYVKAASEHGLLRLDLSSSRVTLGVRAERYGSRERTGDTRYEISVPVGTRVRASAVSGDITVRGVRAETELRTVSGDIVVGDAARRVDFTVVSGDVEISGLTGDVRGTLTSGDVRLENVTGEIEIETVSGEVEIERTRSRSVRLKSLSGNVEYEGSIEPSGRYELASHSGDILLVIPPSVSADVSLETFSGSIDSEFPMTLQPGEQRRRSRMESRIGAGGARIVARTFSGNIEIRRQR